MGHVRLDHVWKRYGRTEAVKDLCLEVRDGELMALLGPSGCGKTSTLRMIAGLEEVTEGEVYFDEKPVTRLRPAQRDVAMAFENYALYPALTVRENVAFPLVARRYSKAEIQKRVASLLEMLEIEELADRKPEELSDGQKQRVGLARALVREPAVLLMDEPISHLDARQRARMRTFLKRLHYETKVTMIMVTHDQVEAMAMADRVAVMNDGRLEQVASPEELYEGPRTQFVASFIGEPPMNLLSCRLSVADGRLSLSDGSFAIDLPASTHPVHQVGAGETVILGIRPEDLEICEPDGGRGVFLGEVELVEDLGDEVVVTVRLDGERLQVLVDPGAPRPRAGARIALRPKVERIHVFSRETGLTLIDRGPESR